MRQHRRVKHTATLRAYFTRDRMPPVHRLEAAPIHIKKPIEHAQPRDSLLCTRSMMLSFDGSYGLSCARHAAATPHPPPHLGRDFQNCWHDTRVVVQQVADLLGNLPGISAATPPVTRTFCVISKIPTSWRCVNLLNASSIWPSGVPALGHPRQSPPSRTVCHDKEVCVPPHIHLPDSRQQKARDGVLHHNQRGSLPGQPSAPMVRGACWGAAVVAPHRR